MIEVTESEYVTAIVGRHNLKNAKEFDSKNHSIYDLILHPDWNFNEKKFIADLAIVVLYNQVELNDNVQLICLPQKSYAEPIGVGSVIGWGKSETSYASGSHHDSTPNKVEIPVINGTHCLSRFPILADIASNSVFCGGYDGEGKAPCTGDSGGGFYIRGSSAWKVQGIVSSAVIDLDRGCDINKYTLYTNIARYIDWVNQVIANSRTTIFEDVELRCRKS